MLIMPLPLGSVSSSRATRQLAVVPLCHPLATCWIATTIPIVVSIVAQFISGKSITYSFVTLFINSLHFLCIDDRSGHLDVERLDIADQVIDASTASRGCHHHGGGGWQASHDGIRKHGRITKYLRWKSPKRRMLGHLLTWLHVVMVPTIRILSPIFSLVFLGVPLAHTRLKIHVLRGLSTSSRLPLFKDGSTLTLRCV